MSLLIVQELICNCCGEAVNTFENPTLEFTLGHIEGSIDDIPHNCISRDLGEFCTREQLVELMLKQGFDLEHKPNKSDYPYLFTFVKDGTEFSICPSKRTVRIGFLKEGEPIYDTGKKYVYKRYFNTDTDIHNQIGLLILLFKNGLEIPEYLLQDEGSGSLERKNTYKNSFIEQAYIEQGDQYTFSKKFLTEKDAQQFMQYLFEKYSIRPTGKLKDAYYVYVRVPKSFPYIAELSQDFPPDYSQAAANELKEIFSTEDLCSEVGDVYVADGMYINSLGKPYNTKH